MPPKIQPTLMAIGGALDLEKPGLVLQEFWRRSGGPAARLAILPTASGRPEAGNEYLQALSSFELERPPQILQIRSRAEARQPAHLAGLKEASGICLIGGNQMRLTAFLGGTPVESSLHEAYRRGAVIAGISAGAAALSTVMIAHGHGGPTPRQRIAHFAPGFGFTDRAIFDQHFRQRDRLGRLLFAVACHPGVLGIGIDEDTAAILEGDRLIVCGKNAVTIVDGSELLATDVADVDGARPIALSGARIHVLTHGCSYHLVERRAQIPEKLLEAP